ncbi:MAG TPA: hypothetical protein VFK51_04730 [Burkholderiales bacterium]|nr:hypothetical protein [Burkholderiales bacterium]
MNLSVIRAALIAVCLTGVAGVAHADTYRITPDEWAQPRSGAEMAAMAPVRAAVQDWMKHPGDHIVILHSGDDIGSLWSSEVHDWLVSLGIPSRSIETRISGQDENTVTLSVEP